MHFIDMLVENHPIRKTKQQKQSFREWFIAQAEEMGYAAQADEKGYSRNVTVGDPDAAKVIFTAHYDTPPVMPIPNFITPRNIVFYLVYQLGIALLMILVAGGAAALAGWLTKVPELGGLAAVVTCYAMLGLLLFGPANKNCVNDNTSGVAAVMEIMSRLTPDQRAKAAFVLFDNEEKGLLGSASFASKHKEIKKNTLLINLDCVGDGEHVFFFTGKKTRALPAYALLTEALSQQEGRQLHMENMEPSVYPSDQANFNHGIAVCSCNHMKVLGYYVDKIHTKKDTVCNQENMDFLGQGLSRFVEKLEA